MIMTIKDIDEKQTELLKKVQTLFENKRRTQRDIKDLYDEIQKFEKERASLLVSEVFGETKQLGST